MNRPVNFGVIGVGGIGAAHARFVSELEETRLSAVADCDVATVQRVACERNCRAFTDGYALLDSGDIAAVIIATPHPLHVELTRYAAARGIHVLCEKSLAASVADADAMIQSCRENGVLLGTVFQQRTEPLRRTMKRLVGELGEIYRVSLSVCYYRPQSYYDSADWRGTWRGEGGGILMQAAHALDQLAWLAGMPERVQTLTLTRLHQIETENTAVSMLDYGGGKAGWFYISTADALEDERIELSGERGALVWQAGQLRHLQLPQPLSKHLHSAPEMFEPLSGKWRDVEVDEDLQNQLQGHREIVRAFARAVCHNDASLMFASGEDGLRSLELANAMMLAGQCSHAVELPLDRARYQAMLDELCASEYAGRECASGARV